MNEMYWADFKSEEASTQEARDEAQAYLCHQVLRYQSHSFLKRIAEAVRTGANAPNWEGVHKELAGNADQISILENKLQRAESDYRKLVMATEQKSKSNENKGKGSYIMDKLEKMEETRDKLQLDVTKLQAKLAEAEDALSVQETASTELEMKLFTAEQSVKQMSEVQTRSSGDYMSVRKELMKNSGEIVGLEKELDETRVALSEALESKQKLEKEQALIAATSTRKGEENTALLDAREMIRKLEERVTRSEEALSDATTCNETLERDTKDLSLNMTKLKSELKQTTNALHEAYESKTSADISTRGHLQRANSAERQMKSAEDKLSELQSANDDLETKLAAMGKEFKHKSLATELDFNKAATAELYAAQDEIKTLKRQLSLRGEGSLSSSESPIGVDEIEQLKAENRKIRALVEEYQKQPLRSAPTNAQQERGSRGAESVEKGKLLDKIATLEGTLAAAEATEKRSRGVTAALEEEVQTQTRTLLQSQQSFEHERQMLLNKVEKLEAMTAHTRTAEQSLKSINQLLKQQLDQQEKVFHRDKQVHQSRSTTAGAATSPGGTSYSAELAVTELKSQQDTFRFEKEELMHRIAKLENFHGTGSSELSGSQRPFSPADLPVNIDSLEKLASCTRSDLEAYLRVVGEMERKAELLEKSSTLVGQSRQMTSPDSNREIADSEDVLPNGMHGLSSSVQRHVQHRTIVRFLMTSACTRSKDRMNADAGASYVGAETVLEGKDALEIAERLVNFGMRNGAENDPVLRKHLGIVTEELRSFREEARMTEMLMDAKGIRSNMDGDLAAITSMILNHVITHQKNTMHTYTNDEVSHSKLPMISDTPTSVDARSSFPGTSRTKGSKNPPGTSAFTVVHNQGDFVLLKAGAEGPSASPSDGSVQRTNVKSSGSVPCHSRGTQRGNFRSSESVPPKLRSTAKIFPAATLNTEARSTAWSRAAKRQQQRYTSASMNQYHPIDAGDEPNNDLMSATTGYVDLKERLKEVNSERLEIEGQIQKFHTEGANQGLREAAGHGDDNGSIGSRSKGSSLYRVKPTSRRHGKYNSHPTKSTTNGSNALGRRGR